MYGLQTLEKKRPASPLARKMCAEAGIELSRVRGSGPGGRITKRDVEYWMHLRDSDNTMVQ